MTEIKIKRLSLENFKCHKALKLDFMGGNASVYGDNASGKTSIYDALTWLLFGKDSQGNGEKNIEIKPLDANGEVKDHDALTAVEAVLDVNGEEVSLRRTYREVWTTKRGSSQATYDGNTSEYYVSGVPCKRNAFQDKVNELVSEDTFRMLTSVSYFANGISWQDRRAVLFKVAGVMDDAQILATNEQFIPLVESMGKLGLEDYKKKLLAEKRKFVGAKTEIPARISECQKTIEDIQGLDFAGAKAQVEALQATLNGLSEQIISIEHDSAADQKRMEIRETQLELSKLEAENKAYRDSQTAGSVDTKALYNHKMVLEMSLKNKRDALSSAEKVYGDYDRRIEESRNRWISVNSERFAAGNCPTCGQKLPAEQLQKAEGAFEAGKRGRLTEIEQTANALKQAKADTAERIENLRKEIGELETGIADAYMHITAAENVRVEPKDMDGFAASRDAITARINALSGELADISQNSYDVKEKLRREKDIVSMGIAEQMRIVNKESLLDYSRERIESLREDAKNAAECLEAIEKMLFLIDEYSRYKTRFVENSINGLFRIARFRLFREQANGGIEDRCDVVYDGIPYISVNNGMKINLGIDIINTLSVAYGVRVPLFVDNAESVTELECCNSQIIRLVVSKNDKELRVNYEN
jgi:hypothetical protein